MSRTKIAKGHAFAATIVAVALINPLATAIAGAGSADPGAPPEEPMLSPEQAMITDLQTIADMWNVSMAQAATIVEAQQAIDTIDFESIDPGYVAVETTPGSPLEIDYYSTAADVTPALDALANSGLGVRVRSHAARFSVEELRAAQQALKETYPGLEAISFADYRAGGVRVEVAEQLSTTEMDSIQSTIRIPILWWTVETLSIPATSGGLPFSACTGGFVVEVNGTSNRGLATAGHCANTGTYDGYSLNFKGERYRDRYDIQWMDNANVNWTARFKWQDGQPVREVLGRMAYSNMDVGDPVCKYGKNTTYTCGDITDNTACPPYVESCDSYFVVAHNPSQDMITGGDSGGPVFFGTTAIGFTSGETGPVGSSLPDLIFMPQQFVDFFALHVAIAG